MFAAAADQEAYTTIRSGTLAALSPRAYPAITVHGAAIQTSTPSFFWFRYSRHFGAQATFENASVLVSAFQRLGPTVRFKLNHCVSALLYVNRISSAHLA